MTERNKYNWRVMAQGEDRTVWCPIDDLKLDEAQQWIVDNEHRWPEATFWLERMDS